MGTTVARMGEKYIQSFIRDTSHKDHLEVDGRVILKLIFKK
jgi:hypothetical protein